MAEDYNNFSCWIDPFSLLYRYLGAARIEKRCSCLQHSDVNKFPLIQNSSIPREQIIVHRSSRSSWESKEVKKECQNSKEFVRHFESNFSGRVYVWRLEKILYVSFALYLTEVLSLNYHQLWLPEAKVIRQSAQHGTNDIWSNPLK